MVFLWTIEIKNGDKNEKTTFGKEKTVVFPAYYTGFYTCDFNRKFPFDASVFYKEWQGDTVFRGFIYFHLCYLRDGAGGA